MEARLIAEGKRPIPASIFISALGLGGHCDEPNAKIIIGRSHFPEDFNNGTKGWIVFPISCGEDGDAEQLKACLNIIKQTIPQRVCGGARPRADPSWFPLRAFTFV